MVWRRQPNLSCPRQIALPLSIRYDAMWTLVFKDGTLVSAKACFVPSHPLERLAPEPGGSSSLSSDLGTWGKQPLRACQRLVWSPLLVKIFTSRGADVTLRASPQAKQTEGGLGVSVEACEAARHLSCFRCALRPPALKVSSKRLFLSCKKGGGL